VKSKSQYNIPGMIKETKREVQIFRKKKKRPYKSGGKHHSQRGLSQRVGKNGLPSTSQPKEDEEKRKKKRDSEKEWHCRTHIRLKL